WGRSHEYWAERQVFLLGAKFDTGAPWEDPSDPLVLDTAIALVLAERNRVGWWQREPMYRDRWGITELPAGVDVRHFIDHDGVSLLVIDNWNQLTGQTVKLYGEPVAIPPSRLSIVEFSANGQ